MKSILEEFVNDVEAAYGHGDADVDTVVARLTAEVDWPDLGITYRKAKQLLNLRAGKPESEKKLVEIDMRDLGTILAALRTWQRHDCQSRMTEINAIASDDGSFEPLGMEEVDELCERLNCDDLRDEPCQLERAMQIAQDTRKMFNYGADGWHWCDRGDQHTLYGPHDTFWAALMDAVEPYLEEEPTPAPDYGEDGALGADPDAIEDVAERARLVLTQWHVDEVTGDAEAHEYAERLVQRLKSHGLTIVASEK